MNTQPKTEVRVEAKAKKTRKRALQSDSAQMLYTEEVRPVATRVIYEIAADSAISEKDIKFPEFITEDFDKQLSNWQAQTFLQKVDQKQSKNKNLHISDTIYAKKLASMQSIVRMPYNSMVRTFIDTYVKRGHRQVSFMLGVSGLYMPIFDEEINRARGAIGQLGGKISAVEDYAIPGTDVKHRLVVIDKVRSTPPQFPRAWAKIKKSPLK